MKYQVLFSLKNNEKVYMKVVCCSLEWWAKGYCHISDIVYGIILDWLFRSADNI